jgi:hypothetical protein
MVNIIVTKRKGEKVQVKASFWVVEVNTTNNSFKIDILLVL